MSSADGHLRVMARKDTLKKFYYNRSGSNAAAFAAQVRADFPQLEEQLGLVVKLYEDANRQTLPPDSWVICDAANNELIALLDENPALMERAEVWHSCE